MINYNLGRVAFVDKGVYSSSTTYNKWDFVTTSDSTYLYINDTPQAGTSVTDTTYWKCLADGKSATMAAASINNLNLTKRIQTLEDYFIEDVLPNLTFIDDAKAGATISSDNKLIIPQGQTGFDSRMGYVIPASFRNIKFKISANKPLAGIIIFLSDVNYLNGVQIATPSWEQQEDGSYIFEFQYLINGSSLQWLWMWSSSNVAMTDQAEVYFSTLNNISDQVFLNQAYDLSKNGIRTFETLGNINRSEYGASFGGTDGICTNKVYASGNGKIKSISFCAYATGTASFATGIVDQWGKAIIDQTFSITVTALGIQTHSVDVDISAGQMLFAILDTKIIGFTLDSDPISLIYYNDVDRHNALSGFPAGNSGHVVLSFEVEYATENLIDLYDKASNIQSKINSMNSEILALQNSTFVMDKITGEKYKISIANGTLFAKSNIVKKVLALGNSITRHPITSFWWGDWGMAATERSKDWVHQLQTHLQTKWQTAIVNALNIATFETNPLTYNFADLDVYLTSDIDVVIIKLGENVSNLNDYSLKFHLLINYIWSKVPTCDIIIGGMSWSNIERETMMKQVALDKGIPFVDISYMWNNSQYISTLDTMVYGDDLVWHKISDGGDIAPGVAAHPNDYAHQVMADSFATVLGY